MQSDTVTTAPGTASVTRCTSDRRSTRAERSSREAPTAAKFDQSAARFWKTSDGREVSAASVQQRAISSSSTVATAFRRDEERVGCLQDGSLADADGTGDQEHRDHAHRVPQERSPLFAPRGDGRLRGRPPTQDAAPATHATTQRPGRQRPLPRSGPQSSWERCSEGSRCAGRSRNPLKPAIHARLPRTAGSASVVTGGSA
jgi:hypothetical protein